MNGRSYLPLLTAAGSGLIFGVGLAIAQMTDPEKVKAFLDVATIFDGAWDPSLAFVMGGGLIVAMLFYRLSRPLRAPFVSPAFVWPKQGSVDRPLVIGSALFGVGWGMAGLCPGPAIADLGLAPAEVGLFATAMLVGSWGAGWAMTARSLGWRLAGGNVPAA